MADPHLNTDRSFDPSRISKAGADAHREKVGGFTIVTKQGLA
jgi:hypothetical protein